MKIFKKYIICFEKSKPKLMISNYNNKLII